MGIRCFSHPHSPSPIPHSPFTGYIWLYQNSRGIFRAIKSQAQLRGWVMKNSRLALAVVIVFAVLMAGARRWASSSFAATNPRQQSKVDFARDVQPIFQAHCYGCHGPNRQMAGLRLDLKKAALAKVIVPGKANESALYHRVAGMGDQARMPMNADALKPDQVALIRRWIDEGADWPENEQFAIRNPQS